MGLNKNKPLNEKYVVNKSLLTNGIYKEFILNFIYNKGFSNKKVKQFFLLFIQFTHTQKGKHYTRVAIRPYKKWASVACRMKENKKKNKT